VTNIAAAKGSDPIKDRIGINQGWYNVFDETVWAKEDHEGGGPGRSGGDWKGRDFKTQGGG